MQPNSSPMTVSVFFGGAVDGSALEEGVAGAPVRAHDERDAQCSEVCRLGSTTAISLPRLDRCRWPGARCLLPENTARPAVPERAGLLVIGNRERTGRHHGIWPDVVLVERRSNVITRLSPGPLHSVGTVAPLSVCS
ncbi:hypothetical protein ACFYXH_06705 [Streptomyces sp. NPDC002730]|uniref:hypothetical protein n=1 Tax=Streptomyces sp. NPDC002730 TaxID=3364662 RepID=UPI0036CEDC1F